MPAGKGRLADGVEVTLSRLVDRADAAHETFAVDPEGASERAHAVLAEADAATEGAARSVALRVLALGSKLRGDARRAEQLLYQAIEAAAAAGAVDRAAQARLSLVSVLADRGELDAALAEADTAADALRGVERGKLEAQRSIALTRAGHYAPALLASRRALRLVSGAHEPQWTCRIRSNKGALLGYLGRYQEARRELRRAHRHAVDHGLDIFAGRALQNLGFVALNTGDIPEALRLFAEAKQSLPPGGVDQALALLDVTGAYLTGRLLHEAREALEQAVATLRDGGFAVDVAEAQLLLARIHLFDDDPAGAQQVAATAAVELRRQRRPGWTALAEHLALNARVDAGERSSELLDELRRSARRLADRGWAHATVHSHVLAGDLAHRLGHRRIARNELDKASKARDRGPIAVRAPAWYATAVRRLVDDDVSGALRAARAGLRAVDDFAATLGATDLRVRASGWGEDLARLGVRLTKDGGNAWRYLTWVERWRANELRRPPVRPPHDAKLAADLAHLRSVTSELAAASARGEDARALNVEQVRLERAIRDRSRTVGGRGRKPAAGNLERIDLADRLGDAALVELTEHEGDIVAITFAAGRCRLHELGPVTAVTAEMDSLRFSLHRTARRHGSAASLAAAEKGIEYAGNRLDELLLRPLFADIGDRDLVITPTGALHALPWAALPSLRGRPISVAPSATTWLSANARTRGTAGPTVVAAGPGLEHARAEARAVARHHTGARQFTGRRATVAATLEAIDRAQVAHLATHGTFRSDNPQFASLDLADGPLTVYDLERLRQAPRLLVLSACDTALSAVHAGDELQGVAAAFFTLGTRTLVASVTPVADDETRAVMARFHRLLAAGTSPARALADAGTDTGTLGFVCFGVG